MKKIYIFLFVLSCTISQVYSQTIINLWDFESSDLQEPTIGEGTIELIGSCADFDGNPWVTGNPGIGYNTSNYPEQNTGQNSAGIKIVAENVEGYNDYRLSFDKRNSNTASKYFNILYSVDGGNTWVEPEAGYEQIEAEAWEHFEILLPYANAETSSIIILIRSIYHPTIDDGYIATGEGYAYSPNGTMRYDNITLTSGPLLATNDFIQSKITLNTVWNNFVKVLNVQSFQYKIYDLSGRVVKYGSALGNENIFIGDLPNGNYVISIIEPGEIENTFKAIKK